jgi:hypothetical protein
LMLTLLFSSLLLNIGGSAGDPCPSPAYRRQWWRLGLPLLFVLWANCHLGFIFGLALLAAIAIDECAAGRARVRSWLPLWLGCAAATLANPYGYKLHLTAFAIVNDSAAMNWVYEWLSPSFHDAYNLPFLGLLLVAVAAGAQGWRRRPALTLLVIVLAVASLRSMRNVALFSLPAPLVAADALGDAMARSSDRLRQGLAAAVTCVALLTIGLHLGALKGIGLQEAVIGSSFFPEPAVEYLRGQEGLRNLYDEYKWGGYCLYELYPRQRVFVDGRAEVYFGGPLNDYFEIHYVRPKWREALRRYHVDAALVDRSAPLFQVLSAEPEWRIAYSDDQAAVFVRRR